MSNYIMNKIKREEHRSLDSNEVLKICNNKAKMIIYEDLKNFKNIDELLYPDDSAIILYEYIRNNNESIGHYICINRLPSGEIEHFDSLLFKPDRELNMVPKNVRKKTRQNYSYLAKMLYDSGYPVSYNHYKLQQNDTSTCGRWAGLRCLLKKLTLDEFANLFLNRKHDPDILVTALTM